MLIPRVDCITKYPAIFITGCFYCVSKYVLVLPFAKPSAFRIRSAALYCFCIFWDVICEFFRITSDRRCIVVIIILVILFFQRFLPMRLPVFIDFLFKSST